MSFWILLYLAQGLAIWAIAAGQCPANNKNTYAFIASLVLWPIQVVGNLFGALFS